MKYLLRRKSVITGKNKLEHIYTYKSFPVFIGATDLPSRDDVMADLSLSICTDTGIIQLDKVLPLEVVYSGYHSEALGSVWKKHHVEFLKFLSKYGLEKILEVGGGNGRMALEYVEHHRKAVWTIVDPNPVKLNSDRITYIPEVFSKKFSFRGVIDGIVHSHALEHMYYPREFMETVSEMLKKGEYHIFTLPNLYEYLYNKQTNCLNFEHTIFLTEYFVDYLLYLYGFEIIEKRYFEKHSIFYATRKVDSPPQFRFSSKYIEYKRMLTAYIEHNKRIITKYNKYIDNFSGDVYLFGAHVFSQYLLNQGLKKDKIAGILDNSELKKGKRLYGTNLKVLSPQIIKNIERVVVVLKAGGYQQEIKRQLLAINKKVIILE